jgi:hypothetical protein
MNKKKYALIKLFLYVLFDIRRPDRVFSEASAFLMCAMYIKKTPEVFPEGFAIQVYVFLLKSLQSGKKS